MNRYALSFLDRQHSSPSLLPAPPTGRRAGLSGQLPAQSLLPGERVVSPDPEAQIFNMKSKLCNHWKMVNVSPVSECPVSMIKKDG